VPALSTPYMCFKGKVAAECSKKLSTHLARTGNNTYEQEKKTLKKKSTQIIDVKHHILKRAD
jgi:hypothetical protein